MKELLADISVRGVKTHISYRHFLFLQEMKKKVNMAAMKWYLGTFVNSVCGIVVEFLKARIRDSCWRKFLVKDDILTQDSQPFWFAWDWVDSWHTGLAVPRLGCCCCCWSVAQSRPTLCDPMDCSTPGLPVHHQLPELAQTHVHWVGDAIQPSHLLSSPSLSTFNLSHHLGLFQWVNSLDQAAKVLEFQLQHQSFQWIFRTDLL